MDVSARAFLGQIDVEAGKQTGPGEEGFPLAVFFAVESEEDARLGAAYLRQIRAEVSGWDT